MPGLIAQADEIIHSSSKRATLSSTSTIVAIHSAPNRAEIENYLNQQLGTVTERQPKSWLFTLTAALYYLDALAAESKQEEAEGYYLMAVEYYDQAILLDNVTAMVERADLYYEGKAEPNRKPNYREVVKLYHLVVTLAEELAKDVVSSARARIKDILENPQCSDLHLTCDMILKKLSRIHPAAKLHIQAPAVQSPARNWGAGGVWEGRELKPHEARAMFDEDCRREAQRQSAAERTAEVADFEEHRASAGLSRSQASTNLQALAPSSASSSGSGRAGRLELLAGLPPGSEMEMQEMGRGSTVFRPLPKRPAATKSSDLQSPSPAKP